ncbi:MAG TPA: septal ring lytic transglycosylase RlpA family protein [Terracidiphilus sp.]|jgi:rare lipoprotein A|nr:septal ring lytic transglycosylase RlpA family protein [Terracidiphilus sp.]
MRQNTDNVNRKDPVQFWLIAAASFIALAGIVLTLPGATVQADVVLSRPPATEPPPAPVLSAIPTTIAQKPEKPTHGFASWYGGVFNGRQTANGETFDQNEMTACHPTLPFGTKVKVENTRNHKSVIVRITDRGLLYGRRVIDLSYAAAAKIGMTEVGVAPVTIQVISRPEAN